MCLRLYVSAIELSDIAEGSGIVIHGQGRRPSGIPSVALVSMRWACDLIVGAYGADPMENHCRQLLCRLWHQYHAIELSDIAEGSGGFVIMVKPQDGSVFC